MQRLITPSASTWSPVGALRWLLTRCPVAVLCWIAIAFSTHAAELAYPTEVARWQEVTVPNPSDQAAFAVWLYSANYSPYEWRVLADRDGVHAQLATPSHGAVREAPAFIPAVGNFRGASEMAHVDDGWIVGFNRGEFGAALYWFSPDGKRNYKISDHQIVSFFSLPDGLYAIEGLAHLGVSEGSIVRIDRARPGSSWRASTVAKLPSAPFTVSVRSNHDLLVTLSDSLVLVEDGHKVRTLLHDASLGEFYPKSSVLSKNEEKLYIGMRQFVGEFDIAAGKLRFLVPSSAFLNKLPADDERRIRHQYGG